MYLYLLIIVRRLSKKVTSRGTKSRMMTFSIVEYMQNKVEKIHLMFVLELCYPLFYSLIKAYCYVRNCRKSKKNYR